MKIIRIVAISLLSIAVMVCLVGAIYIGVTTGNIKTRNDMAVTALICIIYFVLLLIKPGDNSNNNKGGPPTSGNINTNSFKYKKRELEYQ